MHAARLIFLATAASLGVAAYSGRGRTQSTATSAAALPSSDLVPCAAWDVTVLANTGSVTLDSQSLVDSFQSSLGPYGGNNVGINAFVRAVGSVTNKGGVFRGRAFPDSASGLAVVPMPAGAFNLPLGSATPGSLNINNASGSITLAPGDYIAENVNVNFPGSLNVSPAGQVRIWVTGNLNLGGSENTNGVPKNLAFLVTSSGWVNVNRGGALFGLIYAPTSGVNLDSPIYGSVIGSTVTLNSGSAVHWDQSSACQSTGGGGPPPPVTSQPPRTLPLPPTALGCYAGTANGWVAQPCGAPDSGPRWSRTKTKSIPPTGCPQRSRSNSDRWRLPLWPSVATR